MQPLRLTFLFALTNLVAAGAGPLQVLRVTPESPANPLDPVTVTFDRPVAGGLDATVDAHAIFAIDPLVPGTVEWRDPVTLRFTPNAPLDPGRTYTITILPEFEAMDGSRLSGPFRYSFHVAQPQVLGGNPVGPGLNPRYLGTIPIFSVLLSAAVDPGALAERSIIQLGPVCGGGTVRLRASGGVRRIGAEDPRSFRYLGYRGPQPPDTARDLRRVVDLVPASPLPFNCGASLVVPRFANGAGNILHWQFHTYGPLRLAAVTCAVRSCPTGPARVVFSTPVRGGAVLQHVRITPAVPFTVGDSSRVSAEWNLDATLAPRQRYDVVVDSTLTDAFGQVITGPLTKALVTTGYAPSVQYEYGRMLVERAGLRTLAVQHVNVDSLVVTTIPVPVSLEAGFLAQNWNWSDEWTAAAGLAQQQVLGVTGGQDQRMITGVKLPAHDAVASRDGTLLAIKVSSPVLDSAAQANRPIALVQVTDLAVTARVGVDQAAVWVTGVQDGAPRPNAVVTLYDEKGRLLSTGRTDMRGLATLDNFRSYPDRCQDWRCGGFEGYVAAALGQDRAVVGISTYDPDLAPWRFNVFSAWGEGRAPLAAAVFTDRGIYRPGEPVYAKAIVRRGPLGALTAPRGDSLRWVFNDRETGVLRDTVVTLSAFGTADQRMPLPADLPLGQYRVNIEVQRDRQWRTAATAHYRVAEYRPPEFLVDVTGGTQPRLAGDSASFHVAARYLFGAPMGHAPLAWAVRQQTVLPWELHIPGVEDYSIGVAWNWWQEESGPAIQVTAQGTDTLDAAGQLDTRIALPEPADGRPARVTFAATVTDANRQTGSAATSVMVHPAAFYIAARTRGKQYFWTAGTPVGLDVLTVTPEGRRVVDIAVQGTVVRREWHQVRRIRGGAVEEVGGWVADTVAHCTLHTAASPAACDFTPPAGGSYTVLLTARDAAGRAVRTSINRWAAGQDWVPWNDESKFKMDVIPDRTRYSVGDTATVFFASPFTDAEAWITVERERVLEQRRMRITSGATTLKFPITEAFAPDVFVSIVVVRGRSAAPGPVDDPGRPTLRVGYAELRVTPEVKRLAVDVQPLQSEYRPGQDASFHLAVHDHDGRGQRAEVTLWAVDEGVLALTGYQTPDPIDLLYPQRGLGMRLASNLVAVAPQIPEGQKGSREPGGGGGADLTAILRSRFQTTAFYLGSVVTDDNGEATASAHLPDNITTFRVMAVAVTEGDRYGSGDAEFLVTRPLVARPALPRFLRDGDRFAAGVVVNSRMGGTPKVDVEARAEGVTLQGKNKESARLAEGRGAEVRFDFRALPADSAHFRFRATSGGEADAVAVAVPVKPSYYPLSRTIAGLLIDTAAAEFPLQDNVDPARSSLEISFGTSPLAVIRGADRMLQVYPYFCTEQVASAAFPLIALLQAQQLYGDSSLAPPDARRQVAAAVHTITLRQRPDGAIGYWGTGDWSTPWLSAYAGRVLLEARAAGFAVNDTVLSRLADYMTQSLRRPVQPHFAVAAAWYDDFGIVLSERLAAADFLSRLGRPDIPTENTLASQAARLHWEDRVLLAEVLARRGQILTAGPLLSMATAQVKVEGRAAVLPDSAGRRFYFSSRARPAARLLEALLTVDPSNPLVGPLVETLVQQGRVANTQSWNTQDYGFTVLALMRYEAVRRTRPQTRIRIRAGRRTLLDVTTGHRASADTTLSVQGLTGTGANGQPVLRVELSSDRRGPVYYFLTVHEAPRGIQLNPIDRGIRVERWYESLTTRKPIVVAREGEVIRVRMKVTVPAKRYFVVLDDPLPAGLEPVDLSLRTVSPFGALLEDDTQLENRVGWYFGSWDSGLWSPFDHKELRDDRVVYSATVLWPGSYTATYLARATTAGTFLFPPAHAEEMYDPGVNGRTGGGEFTVTKTAQK